MKVEVLRRLSAQAERISGVWYRMVESGFAPEMDEIGHTVLHPGRYHPQGEFPVLYLAVSLECAYREKLKQVHGRGQDLLPLVVGSFQVEIARCLNLTDDRVRAALGVSVHELVAPGDFSVPQALAREARRVGFEAIRAPSAVGEDCADLVVFKDKLAPPSRCLLETDSVRRYP